MTHTSAIFLGDIGVGKTTFLTTVSEGRLRENIKSTLGVDNIVCRDGQEILRCWDTSGSDRFVHVVPLFARRCDIAVYVYDARRPQTFENIAKWHDLVRGVEDAPTEHVVLALKLDTDSPTVKYPGMDILDGRYPREVVRELIDRSRRHRASFDVEVQHRQRQCCFGLCM